MIIVWSGWGILIPVFNVVGFFAAAFLVNALGLPRELGTPVGIGVWGAVTGLAVFLAARVIESKPGRVFIDAATERRITVKPSAGSFFFIPTRWWAYINPIAAAVLAVLVVAHVWDPLAETTSSRPTPAVAGAPAASGALAASGTPASGAAPAR
jgi:hypothetical protein